MLVKVMDMLSFSLLMKISFRWEKFLARELRDVDFKSLLQKSLVSFIIGTIGYGVTSIVYRTTGFYFPSLAILTVVAIAAYAGSIFSLPSAIALAVICDYHFVPPIGHFLVDSGGWVHFIIVVGLATSASIFVTSFRSAYLQTIATKQSLAEANEKMEKVLGFVSHDLRNPLSIVMLSMDLMRDEEGNPEIQRDLVARSLRNLKEMDSMIESLLDASRVKSGRSLPLQFSRCDLREEVRILIDEQAAVRKEKIIFTAGGAIFGQWGVK